jgi:hypothetical protein
MAAASRAVPTPLPARPVFGGARPARTILEKRALGVSPDGVLRFLVRVRFVDADGAPTALLGGGDVAFDASGADASAQWQTRMRFGAPSAIVAFSHPGTAVVTVRAAVGTPLAPVRIRLDARARTPAVSAEALGPRAVRIGWFPPVPNGTVRIDRSNARVRTIGLATGATFTDPGVIPGRTYRYAVTLPGEKPAIRFVAVPAEPAFEPVARLGGKAVWLSFSPSPLDADAYTRLDARAIVARARRSGLHAIELRVAYGAFSEITPDDRSFVDALLDEASRARIAVVAWTVPRSVAYEDVAATVASARHRTALGSHFAALAIDLERGDDFLGSGRVGYAALARYVADVRSALGARYPIVATVEDPFLEHLSERDVPYAAIAQSADVLQPMAYWRMLSKRARGSVAVRAALRGSYAAIARAAGRAMPIDIGGQTAGEGPAGAPPAGEVAAAVAESRRLGALGVTFFDWNGTTGEQWRALEKSAW